MRLYVMMLSALCFTESFCREFLYPVATYKDKSGITQVLVVHQKSPGHVELWQWEPDTKIAHKALLSSFFPSGVQISPDKRGFSFVDEGRIRFKEFCKRSPKTVYVPRPLYDIGLVRWHGNENIYFSAKEYESYGIFLASLTAETVTCCAQRPHADCLYPYIVGDTLFYIERSLIHTQPFMPLDDGRSAAEKYHYYIVQTAPSLGEQTLHHPIVDFQTRPIIFLTMFSATQGFVIEHQELITKQDLEISFLVHMIEKKQEKDEWSTEYLFSFSVPTALLRVGSPERLCESLVPLIPRFYGTCFYYVDCTNVVDRCFAVKTFDVEKKIETILVKSEDCYSFVPLLVNSLLFFGGSLIIDESDTSFEALSEEPKAKDGLLVHTTSASAIPRMAFNNDGQICLSFPYLISDMSK